jgi:hypothetical protein
VYNDRKGDLMSNNFIKIRNEDGSESKEYKQLKERTEKFFFMAKDVSQHEMMTIKTRLSLQATCVQA